jgi:2'-5' RNA ligase
MVTGTLTRQMARGMLIEFFNLSEPSADRILADAETRVRAQAPPAVPDERADAAEDRALFFVPLPEQAEADWLDMQTRVADILGPDFTRSTFPHVTVLFMGEIEPEQVETVAQVAEPVIGDVRTWPVHTSGVTAFPPGPDGTPIVLRNWGPFSELNDRLIRALAPEVSQRQFPEFKPRATLGFLNRELTSEEAAAILQLGLDEEAPGVRPWVPTEVVFRVGGTEAARFPLSARIDASAAT